MAVSLSPAERNRLAKIAGLLGSNSPGERANAAMKATNLLADVGVTWSDLIASLPVPAVPLYRTMPETRSAAARMGTKVAS